MPDAPSHTGRDFGGYKVGKPIDTDWFGTTYEAVYSDGTPARIVVLAPAVAAQPDVVARIERDMNALIKLEHPRLLRVFGFGRETDCIYMSAEHAKGVTLEQWLQRVRAMPLKKAIQLVRDAAVALSLPHAERVIHGDLTPRAVFIASDDSVQLGRFGRANLSRKDNLGALASAGLILPAYWSPEAVDGLALTEASDIYSLGAVLYHAVSGAAPYAGTPPAEIPGKVVAGPPAPVRKVNPDVPPTVASVIERMMAKSPAARYARVLDVVRDLDQLEKGGLVAKQKSAIGMIAGAVAAVVVLGAGAAFMLRGPAPEDTTVHALPADDPAKPIPALPNAATQLAFAESVANPERRVQAFEKVIGAFPASRPFVLRAKLGIARTAEKDLGDFIKSGAWYAEILGEGDAPEPVAAEAAERLNLILKEDNVTVPVLKKAAQQRALAGKILDDKRRVEALLAVPALVKTPEDRAVEAAALLEAGMLQADVLNLPDAALQTLQIVVNAHPNAPEAAKAAEILRRIKP